MFLKKSSKLLAHAYTFNSATGGVHSDSDSNNPNEPWFKSDSIPFLSIRF
jgi:hypothetical protein